MMSSEGLVLGCMLHIWVTLGLIEGSRVLQSDLLQAALHQTCV